MVAATAVVFAYHDVGVRCLKTLISAGVGIPLVVTVADDPLEQRWFASVAATAAEYGIPVVATADVPGIELERRCASLQPDFIFSFYYRSLLGSQLLRTARRGALNIHGSLLPKFRGRAPVNWAILRGETETGATLHYMVERADAGDIVDQQAVPILGDDDAGEVFRKVTVAAEIVLARSLPALIGGQAPRRPQPATVTEYFGRRRPEDGRIDWTLPAQQIHNLVRAVAPPFPGAFTQIDGQRWQIHRTRRVVAADVAASIPATDHSAALLFTHAGGAYVRCADRNVLQLLSIVDASGPVDLAALATRLQRRPLALN